MGPAGSRGSSGAVHAPFHGLRARVGRGAVTDPVKNRGSTEASQARFDLQNRRLVLARGLRALACRMSMGLHGALLSYGEPRSIRRALIGLVAGDFAREQGSLRPFLKKRPHSTRYSKQYQRVTPR